MSLSKDQIFQSLQSVNDPELHRNIVALGLVKNVAVCEGYVSVDLLLGSRIGGIVNKIKSDINQAIRKLDPELTQVRIEVVDAPEAKKSADASKEKSAQPNPPRNPEATGAEVSNQQRARDQNPLPEVKHIIAVGAGKGGVGKSTVAVNLAIGLARTGATVGLLDADIYGPSMPTLLGLADQKPHGTANRLFPFFVHGIKAMTLGKLVDPAKPLIWRGPMAHGAFQQLAIQTDWGELDYLIIDLPPGTGDVPLTMSQVLPLSGAVIVCTPQKVAQDDAVRAVGMFAQLDIPVLGVVENMSYFIGDDGKEYDIFGKGGAADMARTLDLPLLGQIPIHMDLRKNSDAGDPRRNFEANPKLTAELESFVEAVRSTLTQRAADVAPTLNIH